MKRLLLGLATFILCASIPGAVIVGNPYILHAGGGPTFVAASTPTSNANVDVPAGVQNGDFLIAYVVNSNPASISVPAAFTQQGTTLTWSPLGYGTVIAYRIASSEPASYSFGTGTRSGFIAAYRNASSIDVSGGLINLASGTSMTLTGISSSGGSLLLSFIQDRDQTQALTHPTGMTSRLESTSTVWRHGLAELLNADSSNRVWTVGASTFGAAGILISIH